MKPMPNLIIGIDPGPEQSGFVRLDTKHNHIVSGVISNHSIESTLEQSQTPCDVAMEMVANYGMPSGSDIFKTCIQIGRFEKSCERGLSLPWFHVFRKEVAVTLCGSVRAKGTNIRQQIIEMYGGQEKAIGGKKCKKCKGKGWFGAGRPICPTCKGARWEHPPGPLHNVSSHAWSALAVALTHAIQAGYLSPLAVNPSSLDRSSLQKPRGCPLDT